MSKSSEKSVVVIGEKKFVNRLLLRFGTIEGDYGEEEIPHMYQTTRSYPFKIEEPEKKKEVVVSIKVCPVFEEEQFFRKAVLDTLSADIFLFVFSAASAESLDEIRDKYIYEVRDYEDKHFKINSDVLELYGEEEIDERPRIPLVLCGVHKKGKTILDKHIVDDCAEDIMADISVVIDLSDDNAIKELFQKISQKSYEFTSVLNKTRQKLEEKKKKAEKMMRQRIKEKHDKIRQRSGSGAPKKRKNTLIDATKRLFKPARKIFHSSRNSAKLQIEEAIGNMERFKDNSLLESDDEGEGEEVEEEEEEVEVEDPEKEGEEDKPFELVNIPFGNYKELPQFLTVVFRCIKKYDYVKGVFDFDQDTEKTVGEVIRIVQSKKRTTRIFLNKYSEKVLLYLTKIVLQSFPQPLCPYGLYEGFLRTNLIKDRLRKIEGLQQVLSGLPGQELEILGILLLMFKHIEKTLPETNNRFKNNFNHLVVLNDISLFLAPIILYSRPPSMVRFLEEKKCVFYMIKEAENIVLPQFKETKKLEDDEYNDEFNDDRPDSMYSMVRDSSQFSPYKSLHEILHSEVDTAVTQPQEEIDPELIHKFDWTSDLDSLPQDFDLEGLMIGTDQKEMEEAREEEEGKGLGKGKGRGKREVDSDLLENEEMVSVEREEEMIRRIREHQMGQFWKMVEEKELKDQDNVEETEGEGEEYEDEGEEYYGEWYFMEDEGEYYFHDFQEEIRVDDDEEEEEGGGEERTQEGEDIFADWEVGYCIPKEYNSDVDYSSDVDSVGRGFQYFLSTLEFFEKSMSTLLSSSSSSSKELSRSQERVILERRVADLEKFLETIRSGEEYKELKQFVVVDEEQIMKKLTSQLEDGKKVLSLHNQEKKEEKNDNEGGKGEEEKLKKLLNEFEYTHQKLVDQRCRFNVLMQMNEDGLVNEKIQKRIEDQKREIQVVKNEFEELERQVEEMKKSCDSLESQISMIKTKNFEDFLMF